MGKKAKRWAEWTAAEHMEAAQQLIEDNPVGSGARTDNPEALALAQLHATFALQRTMASVRDRLVVGSGPY